MTEQNPLSLARTWDLVADGFDRSVWALFSQYGQHALELVNPSPAAHILDVACGVGSLSIPAASRVAEVTAVDFSPKMVAALRRRINADGLSNLHVSLEDGQALPFAESSFDAAFSMFGLMFFPSRNLGFKEMARVLRPGSLAVVSSWPPMSTSLAMSVMVESLAKASGAPMPDIEAPGPLGTVDNILAEVKAGGLELVEISRFEGHLEAETFDVVWGIAHDANVHLQLAKQQLGPEFANTVNKLEAGLRCRLGEPPYRLSLPAFLSLVRAP